MKPQHRVNPDTARPDQTAALNDPAIMEFLYKFPPYEREFECRRDLPFYVLEERGMVAPQRAKGGEWFDASVTSRPVVKRDYTPKEGGYVDHSR